MGAVQRNFIIFLIKLVSDKSGEIWLSISNKDITFLKLRSAKLSLPKSDAPLHVYLLTYDVGPAGRDAARRH